VASFTDYFVIGTASSSRMLNALVDAVMEKVRLQHTKKGRIQGTPEAGWMVIDYGDIVVHLLDEELRAYYNLEELWRDGKLLLRVQ
jgi:ribosome-associated protein